jgi:putative membrane-bound dehydrogenase-like protein
MRSGLSLAVCVLLFAATAASAQPQLGFEVPPGFEVTLYADDSLATDIHCLTFDSKGRVVVSGRNYIKILEDTNGDGKADRAILYSNVPKNGAHGMAFDGNDCIVVGDEGVRRLIDRDGDGKADAVSPVWIRTKNDNEHAANALIRGPDGAFYLICGNDAGIGPEHATSKRSPVKKPNSGTVLRLTADGKSCEILADGLRNPYGLAIGPMGNLFTVDSDGERIYRLPYYAPTRLFEIGIGQHHGWLQHGWVRSWSRPPWFPDAVERLVEVGRGSPTGLHVYRHRMFPERYKNGVFSLCWTFGRIYFFPLEPDGSTFKGKAETFVKTVGDVGFAPTAMAVGPDGALYVSIGGRGTRGSVFRIAYKGKLAETPNDDLYAVLEADEPTSAWSRAGWLPLAKRILEKDGGELLVRIVSGTGGIAWSNLARIRAAEVLAEFNRAALRKAARAIFIDDGYRRDQVPEDVAARVVALSAGDADPDWEVIKYAAGIHLPKISRAAYEAMLRATPEDQLSAPWLSGLNHNDRRVRAAALKVAMGPGRASFEEHRKGCRGWGRCADQLAALWVHGTLGNEGAVRTCIEALEGNSGLHLKLEALRLIQLAVGDVDLSDTPDRSLVGYAAADRYKLTSEVRTRTAESLAKVFPTGTEPLDLELARTLGMLGEEVPGLPEKFFSPKRAKAKDAETDLHYLLCFARIPGARPAEVTGQTAATLNSIYVRYAADGHKPADHAPAVLESMFDYLLKRDPALGEALAADPAFGVAGQELFVARLRGETQRAATRKLLKAIEALDEDKAAAAWSVDLVKLAAQLPPAEARPILRAQFRDARLADAIALVLASEPEAVDAPRFVESLQSGQSKVVKAAAEALAHLKVAKAEPKQIGAAIQAIRRYAGKDDTAVRTSLDRLLSQWTGEPAAAKDDGKLADAWLARFAKLHPDDAKTLTRFGGADFGQWKQRLDSIDWSQGSATRGETVFHRKNCYRCHVDARRLGPDLAGSAQRFSIQDLFAAIIDPSKDIAPAYRGVSIVTTSGKVYTGMMIYQSDQLTLLQTTPDVTARIAGPDIVRVQPATISFMPTGLLDGLEDRDLADLLAYLKTLRKK